jgi:hypothetical protein
MGGAWKISARAGKARRVWLPGKVGILVREVRGNVRRIEKCIDAHDRRCCLCGATILGMPVRAWVTDPTVRVRCEQRVNLVAAWCAEYDEQQAMEWLLGLREAVADFQMREWGLLPVVANVGA